MNSLKKYISTLLMVTIIFGTLLTRATSSLAAGPFAFNFPGELKLGYEIKANALQKYVYHSFTYTDGGVQHKFKAQWSQYTNGEFEEGGKSGIWIFKIFKAWVDDKEDTTLTDAIRSKFYLKIEPGTTNTDGVNSGSGKLITNIVMISCSGSAPGFWTNWFGACNGSHSNQATKLKPRGQSGWEVWTEPALCNNNTIDCNGTFWSNYLYHFGEYVRTSQPEIHEPDLPQAAVNACNSANIQPVSSTGWKLLEEVKKMANVIGENAKDENGGEIKYESVFNPKYQKTDVDLNLYRIFYQENKNYSNKHASKGDQLDQMIKSELAEINSWSEADIQGTHIKFGKFDVTKTIFALAGADLAVNGVAWATAGGSAAKGVMYKAGTNVVLKTAAKTNSSLLLGEAIKLEAKAAASTATATRLSGALASKANLVALVFSVAVTGAAIGLHFYFKAKNDAYFEAIFESLIARYYISKHLEFHECILGLSGPNRPTDEVLSATGFTQAIFDDETKMLGQLDGAIGDDLANTANYAGSTDDGEGCPSWNVLTAAMGKSTWNPFEVALCWILRLAHTFVVWLQKWAWDLLSSQLYSIDYGPPRFAHSIQVYRL